MSQVPPRQDRFSLGRAQKVLLGISTGLLIAPALVLWRYLPQLPARIPTHWSGVNVPDGYGPPSTLWGLWALMFGLWVALGLLAWRAPKGRFTLNGMPPITPQHAERVLSELRTSFLIFQCIILLLLSGIIVAIVLSSLGGPNLMAFSLLLIVLMPLGVGYTLYRMSSAAQR